MNHPHALVDDVIQVDSCKSLVQTYDHICEVLEGGLCHMQSLWLGHGKEGHLPVALGEVQGVNKVP